MHTFSVFFFFFLQFEFVLLCFCFVLFCFFFFNFPSWYRFNFVSFSCWNLILHIFLIIMIIMPCSRMFRDVPECSMFQVLSTPINRTVYVSYVWKRKNVVRSKGPLTYDQASLSFLFAAGRYAWSNYLTICLLLVQNLDFSLIGQETKGS